MTRTLAVGLLSLALLWPTVGRAELPATPAALKSELTALSEALRSGGPHPHLASDQRHELQTRAARLLQRLEGLESWETLAAEERRAIQAERDWLTTAVAAKTAQAPAAEKRVCKLVPILGSNRKERVCRSAAQIEADREAAQEEMRRNTRGG